MKANQFGLNEDDLKSTTTFPPSINLAELQENDHIHVEILSEEPELITLKDKTQYKLNVKDIHTDQPLTLWLSAKSLTLELYKLTENKKNLKGLKISIGVRYYDHETWGKTKAYTITELPRGL